MPLQGVTRRRKDSNGRLGFGPTRSVARQMWLPVHEREERHWIVQCKDCSEARIEQCPSDRKDGTMGETAILPNRAPTNLPLRQILCPQDQFQQCTITQGQGNSRKLEIAGRFCSQWLGVQNSVLSDGTHCGNRVSLPFTPDNLFALRIDSHSRQYLRRLTDLVVARPNLPWNGKASNSTHAGAQQPWDCAAKSWD
eukprot:3635443-Rhodomonas_salina.1